MNCQPQKFYLLYFLLLISINGFAQQIIEHTVKYGETKYRLSKIYEISIEELERQNPQIKNGLYAGQKLTIDTSHSKTENRPESKFQKYMVNNGDTVSGIASNFNISVDALMKANPKLANGLFADTYIYIPLDNSYVSYVPDANVALKNGQATDDKATKVVTSQNVAVSYTETDGATNKLIGSAKEKVLKIGFIYPSEIESADLYSGFKKGAEVAIDSVDGLGVTVSTIEVVASKLSSRDFLNLSEADALVSLCDPKTTTLVLSKINKKLPVSYALPEAVDGFNYEESTFFSGSTIAYKQNLILNYLAPKGNVIVLEDDEMSLSEEFKSKFSGLKFVHADASGIIDEGDLNTKLVSSKTNYVVLNTLNSNAIISATNQLLRQTNKFKIQLASFLTLEEFSSDRVSNKRYMVLKLIFPQFDGYMNRAGQEEKFVTRYKTKYNNIPTEFAVSGFDVTFDFLLRLAQDNISSELVTSAKTKHVKSSFLYKHSEPNVYINQALKIYQLENENTILELE